MEARLENFPSKYNRPRDFDSCRERLLHLLNKYERKGKLTYVIDGNTGESRVNAIIISKTFNFDAKIFWLSESEDNEAVEQLSSQGFTKERLLHLRRNGITVKETMFLLRHLAGNAHYSTDTTELVSLIEKTGYKSFFADMFKGLIPRKHLFGIKASKAKEKTIRLVEREYKELIINQRLAASLPAFREVPTPSGNIDLLTADKLIELKSGEDWKHGIGQLIAYGYHIPDKQKVLWLFDYENVDLADVRAVCASVGIEVMLEP